MNTEMMHVVDEEEGEKSNIDVLRVFAQRLLKDAMDQVGKRVEIEDRWMEDLRRIKGQYEQSIQTVLDEDDTKSSAFVNITRTQCNIAKGRLGDMLFPSDDKNWGIGHTPVPEFSKQLDNQDDYIEGGVSQGLTVGEMSQAVLDELKENAANMEKVIDDQLTEGKFPIECREVISDGIEVGTGILKGPFIIGRSRKAWEQDDNVYALKTVEETTPVPQRVDYWNFFPDMSVADINDAAFVFERHYMSKADLKNLIGLPEFLEDQIEELLKTDPRESNKSNSRLQELRALGGITTVNDDNRYEVWEYHGDIDREELEACGCKFEEEDDMPLYSGIVWFCGSHILKAVINPIESKEMPYSVWCWEQDKTSIFGFGVSYQMKNSQSAANAAWRGVLENGGLTVGSQIVIDDDAIEPVNGKYELTSKKVWRKKASARNVNIKDVFATFDIPSRQNELMAILDKAMMLADIETNLPSLQPGNDQAPPSMVQGSATGASIWANSSNVEFRKAVKNYDDTITMTIIPRFYDWNMQFNDDETIKGDYKVSARGSSVLMVKEMQAQNLMQLMQFAGHPVFGQMLKSAALFRKVVQSFQLSADEIVMTDDEIEQMRQKLIEQNAGQPEQGMTPYEAARIELDREKQIAEMQDRDAKRNHELQMKSLDRETQVMKLSADNNISIEKISLELEKIKSGDRKVNAERQSKVDEMNMKITTGMQGI